MDIMITLMLMLPGVPCIYYGQEIGMMDNTIRSDQLRDLFVGRDPERLPMQWDDTLNAGIFSNRLSILLELANFSLFIFTDML